MHQFGIAMQAHDVSAAVASLAEDVEFRSPWYSGLIADQPPSRPVLYAVADSSSKTSMQVTAV